MILLLYGPEFTGFAESGCGTARFEMILDGWPGTWDGTLWLNPMYGLTIPYRPFRLHLALAPGKGPGCPSSKGHKRLGASEIPVVMGALRAAGWDPIVMGELRVLVARCGQTASAMSDGEVLEKIGHLLSAGYVQALRCGGKVAAPAPPSITFGKLQVHVGSPAEDFTACGNHHSHEALQGKKTAERLERLLRSAPASAVKLVDAAAKATGNTAMRNLPLAQLIASLGAMIARREAGAAGMQGGKRRGAGSAAGEARSGRAIPLQARPAETETPLTWISIELVDEDGNPLDGEDYEISLTDGSSHKGKTKGPFRKDQIPEGVCSVKFPNLHKNYWRPPGSK